MVGADGESGEIKSLDGVVITTKSLFPFNPQYGSIVSTTGFTEQEIAELKYTWSIAPGTTNGLTEADIEEYVTITSGSNGKEFAFEVKGNDVTYGKTLIVKLLVESDVVGYGVPASIVYRIDNKGTFGGDSNMERGRTTTNTNDDTGNYYSIDKEKATDGVDMQLKKKEVFFCNEYGCEIEGSDKYVDCVELVPKSDWIGGYYLTFTNDLPPDREFYVMVRLYFEEQYGNGNWTYERIHYIPAVQLSGETTYISGQPDFYGRFYTNYSVVGYYFNAWTTDLPVTYEITFTGNVPEGVTIDAYANPATTEDGEIGRMRVEFSFDIDTGGKQLWEVQKESNITSATIKISYKDYPEIYTYSTVIFE